MMVMMMVRAMVMMLAVGAGFGLEGGLEMAKIRTQAKEHRLDHVVRANAQGVLADLGQEMPIAEMPGDLDEIRSSDLDHGLGQGLDLEHGTILEAEALARLQAGRFGEVDQDVLAAPGADHVAPASSALEIEGHGVDGAIGSLSGLQGPAHQKRK
jgi:hypothetical protein